MWALTSIRMTLKSDEEEAVTHQPPLLKHASPLHSDVYSDVTASWFVGDLRVCSEVIAWEDCCSLKPAFLGSKWPSRLWVLHPSKHTWDRGRRRSEGQSRRVFQDACVQPQQTRFLLESEQPQGVYIYIYVEPGSFSIRPI